MDVITIGFMLESNLICQSEYDLGWVVAPIERGEEERREDVQWRLELSNRLHDGRLACSGRADDPEHSLPPAWALKPKLHLANDFQTCSRVIARRGSQSDELSPAPWIVCSANFSMTVELRSVSFSNEQIVDGAHVCRP
jgi:hypothetical protein